MSNRLTVKTSSEWIRSNPILRRNFIGTESDTGLSKAGDDVSPWNSLNYIGSSPLRLPKINPLNRNLSGGTGLSFEGSPSSSVNGDIPWNSIYTNSETEGNLFNTTLTGITVNKPVLFQYSVEISLLASPTEDVSVDFIYGASIGSNDIVYTIPANTVNYNGLSFIGTSLARVDLSTPQVFNVNVWGGTGTGHVDVTRCALTLLPIIY